MRVLGKPDPLFGLSKPDPLMGGGVGVYSMGSTSCGRRCAACSTCGYIPAPSSRAGVNGASRIGRWVPSVPEGVHFRPRLRGYNRRDAGAEVRAPVADGLNGHG